MSLNNNKKRKHCSNHSSEKNSAKKSNTETNTRLYLFPPDRRQLAPICIGASSRRSSLFPPAASVSCRVLRFSVASLGSCFVPMFASCHCRNQGGIDTKSKTTRQTLQRKIAVRHSASLSSYIWVFFSSFLCARATTRSTSTGVLSGASPLHHG